MSKSRIAATFVAAVLGALASAVPATAGSNAVAPLRPEVGTAVAFDVSAPLRDLPTIASSVGAESQAKSERGAGPVGESAHARDGALQSRAVPNAMPSPMFTFEGPANADNLRIFGFRVNPPDSDGDIGRRHYVSMVNLVYEVFNKQGGLIFGPFDIGSLWAGFAVDDCTDPSGDPIVVYDELSNRWILTQFTTRGPEFFNCVAVSTTNDPTGSFYRYAFSTGPNFPDYPKYGVMPDGLYITTREFDPADNESIGIYAIDRQELVAGDPNPTVVSFNLASPPYLVGDGLLPADLDGNNRPPARDPEYFAGTMDDGAPDGAPFDAINWFEADIRWNNPGNSTFGLTAQLPTAAFDSIYPCAPTSRDCLPQPGITDPNQYLDILSYRQRPTWRLQYRIIGSRHVFVTNQSVEARPNLAGVRWYELRLNNQGDPFIRQQGTWAPDDGVHRWMGSVATDQRGNMAVGYSVVNATNVSPGVRYAGRLAGDPLGELTQGEAVLQHGTGAQLTTNSRWGDYTSMNVDPVDDCTFYYINEYYAVRELAAWQNRIGAFRFPNCH
jgi:hypothetical protein